MARSVSGHVHAARGRDDRAAAAGRAGQLCAAAALYAIAALGFSGNNMFSMRCSPTWREPKSYDRVSALGYALG